MLFRSIDDKRVESSPSPEMAVVLLSNSVGAVIADTQGTLRIFDDDGEPNSTQQINLDIDPITGDNLLSLDEASGEVTITGNTLVNEFGTSFVTLTINNNEYTTRVGSDGTYSIVVDGQDLAEDADKVVDGVVVGFGSKSNPLEADNFGRALSTEPCVLQSDLSLEITDRKSTRLNSSHSQQSRMPSSA